jgi:protein-S-isoprenylcysteine O-methyltransferase Ste14
VEHRKYKKIFGVGPFGAIISVALFIIAWWIDQILGHLAIFDPSVFIKIIAVLLMVMGLGLHLWTGWTLRNWWFNDQLCTIGPFRYLRHPMYAAWITFIALGVALYLNSWIFILWYLLLQPIWHRLVVMEEVMMADTFGSDYQSYVAHTGRFIPKLFKK